MQTEKRGLARIRKDRSGCWIWFGAKDADGYGRTRFRGSRERAAHRFAWEVAHGPVPKGLHVLHRCDRRDCVNPAHLFLGTHADNMRDRDRKGRCVVPVRAGGRWTGEVRRHG